MEHEHDTRINADMKTQPTATADSGHLSSLENKSRSSSSSSTSSSCSSSEPSSTVLFQVDVDDLSESTACSTGLLKLGGETQLVSDHEDDKVSAIAIPKHDQSTAFFEVDPDDFNKTTVSSMDSLELGEGSRLVSDPDKKSTAASTAPLKLGEGSQLVSGHEYGKVPDILMAKKDRPAVSDHKDYSISRTSIPKQDQSDGIPTLSPALPDTAPPVQVMERPSEPAPYRIPSAVFARNGTMTPKEWSVASNESLFSIQMGNMSFTKEQLSLFSKSEDLGKLGDPSMANQLMNFSSCHLLVNKTLESGPRMSNFGEADSGLAEAAAETMKVVMSGNSDQQDTETMKLVMSVNSEQQERESMSTPKQALNAGSISPCSDDSGGSHNSFAFPILAGDVGKSRSVKRGSQKEPQPHHQHTQPKPEQPSRIEGSGEANPGGAAQKRWPCCFSGCWPSHS